MAFYRVEPWGAEVDDLRAGIVAATVANASRDPKHRRKPYQPADFMPKHAPAPEKTEQSPEEQLRIIQMWQAAFAARDK